MHPILSHLTQLATNLQSVFQYSTNNKNLATLNLTTFAISAFTFAPLILLSGCSSTPTKTTTAPTLPTKPMVALVLGGGGAKGFAHVGVIKSLEANGIHPNLIVGSSAGSVVGSLYASGKTAAQLEQIALTTQDSDLADFTLSHQGIIEGNKLKDFINNQVGGRRIEQLPIRFAAVATEKNNLKKTVFTQGNTGLIVQASSSVPALFIAPRIPEKVGKKYIDGGVSSLVPVDTAKALGADVIIAVDLLDTAAINQSTRKSTRIDSKQRNIWKLIDQNYHQQTTNADASSNNAKNNYKAAEIKRADVIITPNVSSFSVFDTIQRQQMIDAGEKATKQQMSQIKQAIAAAQPQ
ncbi:patatin-like phospholipase family protein [Psychrobacter sp. I-STPA10]|uniref:patatin-like phospholipase family protein n=1 Tax=Psychrobacter sp. I-STPA10 TaxID=2585769 RepID=UPI001E64E22E|nr:patatin-like phospholipase family protein [Psychrobacter sp. I-STPA10]